MSTISASTTTTTAYKVTADTTGTLVLQTGATPTTALTISSAQVVSLAQVLPEASGGTGTSTGYYGFKNRIINGAMVIDQRNAGAAVTINTNSTIYTLDRWFAYGQATDGVFTVQQAGTGLASLPNGIKVTVTTADASIGATQSYLVGQYIEGFNFFDVNWGTANAKTVTVSFWVYSSVTGTFSGSLRNSAVNRSYPFTYTISSANTWEQKSVTIAGDTTGTWVGATNGIGVAVIFSLGGGSTLSGTAGAWAGANYTNATGATNLISTLNAVFYITGVQLEVGSTATSFDYRPYGTELALCQRYYERRTVGSQNNERLATTGMSNGSTSAQIAIQMLVQKRSAPALNVGNLSNSNCYNGAANGTPTSYGLDNAGVFIVNIGLFGLTAGLATGGAIQWCWNNSSPTPYIEFSSEL